MTSPALHSETRRISTYLAAHRAPGIEATPSVSTASAVIEPVAEKLSPRSERIAGSEGGMAKRITRRLKAVSQTSPSEMTVRRKDHHASGQIFDESGTGLCARTRRNTSQVARLPPVTSSTLPETQ